MKQREVIHRKIKNERKKNIEKTSLDQGKERYKRIKRKKKRKESRIIKGLRQLSVGVYWGSVVPQLVCRGGGQQW